MVAVAVGGETTGDEAGLPTSDEIEHPGPQNPADHLGSDIAGDLVRGEPLAEQEADGDGGVDMTARYMAEGVHTHDHGHPEGEGNPNDPNAELRNTGAQECTPAAGKDQPECAERFDNESICHRKPPYTVCAWPALCPVNRKSARVETPLGDAYRIFFLGLTCFREWRTPGSTSMQMRPDRRSLLTFTDGYQTAWRHNRLFRSNDK